MMIGQFEESSQAKKNGADNSERQKDSQCKQLEVYLPSQKHFQGDILFEVGKKAAAASHQRLLLLLGWVVDAAPGKDEGHTWKMT